MKDYFKQKTLINHLIRDKFALSGLIVLIILYLGITFASFIAPYFERF